MMPGAARCILGLVAPTVSLAPASVSRAVPGSAIGLRPVPGCRRSPVSGCRALPPRRGGRSTHLRRPGHRLLMRWAGPGPPSPSHSSSQRLLPSRQRAEPARPRGLCLPLCHSDATSRHPPGYHGVAQLSDTLYHSRLDLFPPWRPSKSGGNNAEGLASSFRQPPLAVKCKLIQR